MTSFIPSLFPQENNLILSRTFWWWVTNCNQNSIIILSIGALGHVASSSCPWYVKGKFLWGASSFSDNPVQVLFQTIRSKFPTCIVNWSRKSAVRCKLPIFYDFSQINKNYFQLRYFVKHSYGALETLTISLKKILVTTNLLFCKNSF